MYTVRIRPTEVLFTLYAIDMKSHLYGYMHISAMVPPTCNFGILSVVTQGGPPIHTYTYTSIKKMKLKDEVGMAGSKSTQTRFVVIIAFTIHPYASFFRLSYAC